jgi:hypothetical protein
VTPLDAYRQALADASLQVAATRPPGRTQALLALMRAGDTVTAGGLAPSARPGWNLALQLCLEGSADHDEDGATLPNQVYLAAWSERFLADCDQLALADLALARCASGHLQLQQRAPGAFVAWATSRHLSPEQRERADFEWWSEQAARQAAPRLAALLGERDRMRALLARGGASIGASAGKGVFIEASVGDVLDDPAVAAYYRQLGQAHVARFACQLSYPSSAVIGGVTLGQYTEMLALLIGWLHCERDRQAPSGDDTPTPILWDEPSLSAALATALDANPAVTGQALQSLVLDRDNAVYHSALPGGAAPPLLRLDDGRLLCSARGLLGEPLLFLTRELRRRHAQEYHNSAHLREAVFRQDLYRLFDDRRFVLSAGRVELKRSGAARTDLDALIFDRKTGTLGVFELKAQDPFARSVEERRRQRDNFLQANRQISAALEWAQRHGPDDLLARVDQQAARRVHARKVHVFVLGRYLAHLGDVAGGPEPDRRAAWGSWPQVLQIAETGVLAPDQRSPLGALFARLRDAPLSSAPAHAAGQMIAVGDLHLRLFPSFAAMRSELAESSDLATEGACNRGCM